MDAFGVRLHETARVLRQVAGDAPAAPLAVVFVDLTEAGALMDAAAVVEKMAELAPVAGFVYGAVGTDTVLPWSVAVRPARTTMQRDAAVVACALATLPSHDQGGPAVRVAALPALPDAVAETFGTTPRSGWDLQSLLRTLFQWWSDADPSGAIFRVAVPHRLVGEFMDVVGIMTSADGSGRVEARLEGKDTLLWFPDAADAQATRRSVEAVVEEMGGEATHLRAVEPRSWRRSSASPALRGAAGAPPQNIKALPKSRRASEESGGGGLPSHLPLTRRIEPCFAFRKGKCPLTAMSCLRAHTDDFAVCSKCDRRGHLASACVAKGRPHKTSDRACHFGIYCQKGRWCKKEHHPDEEALFRSLGDGHGFPMWKTRFCVTQYDGHSPNGCRFAHSAHELRCIQCRHWGHNKSQCTAE